MPPTVPDRIDLPYDFDTRREMTIVLKLGVGVLAVMVVGGLYMLVARHDVAGAAATLLVDAMLVAFGRVFLRGLPGAEGRITRNAVETRVRRVWGITLPGPVGAFPIEDFRAVGVERVLSSGGHTTGLHQVERVTLIGKPGTPDVPVLTTRVEGDASPGEAIAAALGLMCEITCAPKRYTLVRSRD